MKLYLLAISFFTLSFTAKANTGDELVSSSVLATFNTAFKNAKSVEWKATGTFYKASFELNNQHIAAYFDASAQLVAVTRNITSLQLPVTLQAKLKDNYEGYWISELFEFSNEVGTAYYITLEDGDSKMSLKSTGGNNWEVFSKARKS